MPLDSWPPLRAHVPASFHQPLTAAAPNRTPPTSQAKALHVGSCLETRCAVHRLVFERLVDRVGLEGAWGAAPTPTTIINTITAAGGASHANAAATVPPAQGGGPLQAVLFGVVAVVGGAVRVFFGIVLGAGGALAKFLALGAFLTAARAAVAFLRGGSGGGSAAAGRLPLASLQQPPMQLAWQGAGGPAAAAAAPAAWMAGGSALSAAAGALPQASAAQSLGAQPSTAGVATPQPAAPVAGTPAAPAGGALAHGLGAAGARRHAALRDQRLRAFGPGLDSYDDDGW